MFLFHGPKPIALMPTVTPSKSRVKKPRFFKNKGQSSNNNNWKPKSQYNSSNKGGYKAGFVDRSKIRCFNCDELGHFSSECKKSKKVKKDKAYLELEAKYEALLKKQQGKAYIAEGKSWMTLMMKMRMKSLETMHFWLLSNEIEAVLRKKLEKNEVKLKSFGNASQLVGQYREKNKPCANITIGLDYDAFNNNKKSEGGKGKTIANQDVPVKLRKVDAPLFKACEVNFSEVELVMKQEIVDEDNEKKCTKITLTPKTEKKPMVDQVSKKPIKEIKTENTGKKKKKLNGKIGVNKSNNFAFVADAPRKKYQKCGSTNHLTHLFKKLSEVYRVAKAAAKIDADDLAAFLADISPQAVIPEEGYKGRTKESSEQGSSKDRNDRTKRHSPHSSTTEHNALGNHNTRKGMVLPFEPHSVTFDDITYSVNMPQPGYWDGKIQCFIKRDKANLTYRLFLCLSPDSVFSLSVWPQPCFACPLVSIEFTV
ncbi:hypothetical protein AgCh_026034 [Apium graveolens]